jgi:acyl transferase domain-containing protein/NAD(P)H-dependent flavin oxidoreductase YrpB (nitropropane dioxygenase family)
LPTPWAPDHRETDIAPNQCAIPQAERPSRPPAPPELTAAPHEVIITITPFETPDARVAVAAGRAGAFAVLDLGRDRSAALGALAETARRARRRFGVRVPAGCPVTPEELPATVSAVVLPAGAGTSRWRGADAAPARRVLVEVVSVAEAAAAAAGADGPVDGLIARGSEGGGRVGELSTFVLLQRLAGDASLALPVWAAGGIGMHTAAAAVAGGAAGVVLDVQLALTAEALDGLPPRTAQALAAMDGSETAVAAGHRVFARPDLAGGPAPGDPAAMALLLGAELGPVPGRPPAWLPAGQDGAFAAPLAERYRTVGGVVQAVRAAIGDHLETAAATRPLAPGSGIAARASAGGRPGFRYPVAQGPMTRVSDRPAFAAAVAAAGGLPFLALALMSGEEVAELLAEAAEALTGKAWGVGILGFVPEELRQAQLTAVQAVRPPYALIAGGRPTQAAALEAGGIATFLHVPSPGLLDRFLAGGARRFVFEGSECGGHIGPRASFPLWETQVERLLAFGERRAGSPEFFAGLEILFAGGIHDQRSAAMVAALAAPLAARGAAIGVLMGTAYLFTDAAVATGAILAGFQQAAVECTTTVLLETSPGHATRCADTPYVAAFRRARDGLAAAGAPAQERWAELERLNLGRLRIASKGVRREHGALVAVPAATQRAEGMYMLGQAATARSATTTIEALHEQVTAGASAFLDARAGAAGRRDSGGRIAGDFAAMEVPSPAGAGWGPSAGARPLDVAIVGMACVLPQADGFARYWANILAGVDAVTEVPPSRWDAGRYFDAGAYAAQSAGQGTVATPSKWGGFIPAVAFDALAYGIPPASLGAVEPVQLLALEVAARALADAGYATRPFDRQRAGAVFGAEGGTDLTMAYALRTQLPAYFGSLPPELAAHLPRLTEDSFAGVLANVIAGRIANRLDLGGVNFTVDAACASSLAALDVACKELAAGSSDLMLCGGADLHNGIYDYLMFASAQALSPSGRCRTFDAAADGIALGEGIVCVVLKRLADAERDGDRVYAVVKAVVGSSDGRSLGLTAPRAEGQRRALERAYAAAGVSPAAVGLIEAHGTGTVVGDRTELAALGEVFAAAGATPASCALGSVKSQIGHTKCAAGLAGVVKAAAALYTGVRPPTGPIRQPNPGWDPAASPFFFDQEARPWPAPPEDRHAGVSAFGFGGTNFHAVLSAYGGAPEPDHGLDEWPAELVCLRATDGAGAAEGANELAALVAANERAGRPWSLRDLAAHAAGPGGGPAGAPVHAAFVASDLENLGEALAAIATGEPEAARSAGVFTAESSGGRGRIAFLYPGQGSQRPGMLSELFVAFPRLRRHLRGDAARYVPLLFPPAAFTPADRAAQREAITDTAVAQPVLGIAGLALHDLLTSLGVHPDLAGGHSYGELVALVAAGAIPEADLLRLGEARAAAILAAAGDDPGTMAAVRATPTELRAALASLPGAAEVVLANHNAPDQVVISGRTAAVRAALEGLAARDIAGRTIPVACAFHSPVVAAAAGAFARALEGSQLGPPAYPVWSNTTAAPHGAEPAGIRTLLARQVAEPVRFVEEIEAMYAEGARVFVECGPGRVLTGLVGKILGDRPHTAVACDVSGEPGLRRFLLALAELAAAGVPVDTTRLFRGRSIQAVTPGTVPARPGWTVDGHLVRRASGEPIDGGLRPAADFRPAAPSPALPAMPPASAVPAMPMASAVPAMPPASAAAGESLPVATPPFGSGLAAGGATDPISGAAEPDTARDAAVLEYFRAARELIAAQRDVMLHYLGAAPGTLPATGAAAAVLPPAAAAAPAPPASAAPAPSRPGEDGRGQVAGLAGGRPAVDPPAPAAPAAPEPLSGPALTRVILDLVGRRTGYPPEMLGAGLDLEADLSVDSIKRTEIVMELLEHLRSAGWPAGDGAVERLARLKTIAAMVAWLLDHDEPPAAVSPAPAATITAPAGASPAATVPAGPPAEQPPAAGRPAVLPPQRYLVEVTSGKNHPLEHQADLAGLRLVVVDEEGGVGAATAAALRRHGADALLLGPHHDLEAACAGADGVIHLGALRPGGLPILPAAFAPLRAALIGGARMLVVATGSGGQFGHAWDGAAATDPTPGLGIRGMVRTIAREFPAVLVRAIDLDPADQPEVIAGHLLAELSARSPEPPAGASPAPAPAPAVVGYLNGTRSALRVVAVSLPRPGGDGQPAGGHSEPPLGTGQLRAAIAALGLGPESVVVLTGGGRGITATCAIALGQACGCRIELLGRTQSPDRAEHPDLAQAADAAALRRALAGQGIVRPAEIEAAVRRIVASRELRGTLAALEPITASVRYQSVDVADATAVKRILDEIFERYGRVDGVIHGAGVLEDRLLAEKTPESFTRVFRTKVDGARALAAALEGRLPLTFFAMFGSVSGVFGNPGQVDYAAANDALDTLARMWAGGATDPAVPGRRRLARKVLSVDWGPWASAAGGMVSPELEREYARRGIGMIAPDHGVAALFAELAWGDPSHCQVVYLGGSPDPFAGSPADRASTGPEERR